MTKTELSRFKIILSATIVDAEQLIRHRDESEQREVPINPRKDSKHLHSQFVISAEILALCETFAWPRSYPRRLLWELPAVS
jgi:hypothetical protein